MNNTVVMKLGGSLLTKENLAESLTRYFSNIEDHILLIVGGGDAVDRVRGIDKQANLPAGVAHDMSVMAMGVNGGDVCAQIANAKLVRNLQEAKDAWEAGSIAVVEPVSWLAQPAYASIEKNWDMTSDSISAMIGYNIGCDKLILLKSCSFEGNLELMVATGVVDKLFTKYGKMVNTVAVIDFTTF